VGGNSRKVPTAALLP